MNTSSSDHSLPVRYANGRFGPGNPGRRPGALGKAHLVKMAILDDFLAHKAQMLAAVRGNVHAYMGYVLRLLPSTIEHDMAGVENWSEEEIGAGLARIRAALARDREGREALIELEAVVLGEGSAEPDHRKQR